MLVRLKTFLVEVGGELLTAEFWKELAKKSLRAGWHAAIKGALGAIGRQFQDTAERVREEAKAKWAPGGEDEKEKERQRERDKERERAQAEEEEEEEEEQAEEDEQEEETLDEYRRRMQAEAFSKQYQAGGFTGEAFTKDAEASDEEEEEETDSDESRVMAGFARDRRFNRF